MPQRDIRMNSRRKDSSEFLPRRSPAVIFGPPLSLFAGTSERRGLSDRDSEAAGKWGPSTEGFRFFLYEAASAGIDFLPAAEEMRFSHAKLRLVWDIFA